MDILHTLNGADDVEQPISQRAQAAQHAGLAIGLGTGASDQTLQNVSFASDSWRIDDPTLGTGNGKQSTSVCRLGRP